MMIPDCRKRLEVALEDLKGILAEMEESDEKECPEVDEAKTTSQKLKKYLKQ
uniref:Tubulin-specific chaperone A n=1 Tax=Lotus japonicus TaxID=34305 RepID=I3T9A7_LOTJA|nr:unknown [Lotus japonicus]